MIASIWGFAVLWHTVMRENVIVMFAGFTVLILFTVNQERASLRTDCIEVGCNPK